ncbi:hypothetical protein WL29_15295 [Burkholderia ubonensis]|uniref:Uncharacterized protein n=1 Tax=Burkholderia ubonensis TaxID=101571 RepID=A0A106QGA8_9BURK|nr:hypothetical protein WL29_15295 [Burkholderia ubonensis]
MDRLPHRSRWLVRLRRRRCWRRWFAWFCRRRWFIHEARGKRGVTIASRRLPQNFLVLLEYKLPPTLVRQIVGIPFLEGIGHHLRSFVILDYENTRPKTVLSLRARAPKCLIEPVERTIIAFVTALLRNDWAKWALTANYSYHVAPCRVIPFEAILGITHATMIDMDFADESTTTALVISGIFHLGSIPVTPFKQVFVGDFDLSTVSNEVETKFGIVEITLKTNPTVNAPFCFDNVAAWAASRTVFLAGGESTHAMSTIAARRQFYIDMLDGLCDGTIGECDSSLFAPDAMPAR